MKYKNIKGLQEDEIFKKITECSNELFQLRMTKKLNQVTNPVKNKITKAGYCSFEDSVISKKIIRKYKFRSSYNRLIIWRWKMTEKQDEKKIDDVADQAAPDQAKVGSTEPKAGSTESQDQAKAKASSTEPQDQAKVKAGSTKPQDQAKAKAGSTKPQDQAKAKAGSTKPQESKEIDNDKSNDQQVPLKAEEEEKKKARKPKLKADIRVQQVGHRRKVIDTDKVKERGRKIEVIGHVISDKMDKTITVQIYRKVRHPRVGKYIKKSTKFKAHDEKNTAHVGDQVLIHATRALSKTKYWKLSKIIKSGERL